MKNSRKGFTLIELLVTIILILSVLAVAIVSYISISNNKKEQAYDSVKEEIIGAAKDYFYTKEYLFEGLEEGSSGIITIGKLVEEDYLNKVTDPRDGKTINTCSRVVVTKENGRYKTKYEEYKEGFSCESDNSIILTEPGAPSLDVKVIDGIEGENGWYKSSVVVLAEANTNGNGAITRIGICSNQMCTSYKDFSENDIYEDNTSYINDTKNTTTWYMTENASGRRALKSITISVDKTAPEVNVVMDNSDWTNADKVYYTYEASDNLGLASLVGYWNKAGLTETKSNTKDCWWNGKSYGIGDCLGGNKSYAISKEKLPTVGSDYFSAEGYRKITYKACDQAGNCTDSNEAIAKIDKTAPKVSVVMDNSDWTNADKVYYTYEASDNLGLASLVGYWNKAGLTETKSNSNNCVWNGTSYGSATCLGSNGANQTVQGATSINKRSNFSAEGYRKIRFIACDQAGNCKTSDAAIARIDRTAPEFILTASGAVRCKKQDSNGYNAHGYSARFKDNLSGATIRIFQYYSSWDCGKTKNFGWSDSTNSKSSAEDNEMIYTAFAGCSNNPSPGIRFSLEDAAGNKYIDSTGYYYKELTHAKNSYSYTNNNECDSSKWYNQFPNK